LREAILEAGWPGAVSRLDTALLKAIAEEAHTQNLPLLVHRQFADVADALDAGARASSTALWEEIPTRSLPEWRRPE
jgi:hypothetical protein